MILNFTQKNKPPKQLTTVRNDITSHHKTPQTKKRILHFFKEIGDETSIISQSLKGAKITKNIITELIKLGHKLQDLL